MRKLTLAVLLLLAANIFAVNTFATARELAPRGAAPTSYATMNPRVAFAGERFLTVWIETMGSIGVHLMGTFSDASGQRITPVAFPVLEGFHGVPLQLVGAGDSYALFWRDPFGNTLLTDIGLDGHVTRTVALEIPSHVQIHAAWNGSRFFAAVRHSSGGLDVAEGFLLTRPGAILRRGIPLDDQAYDFHIIPDGDGFAAVTSGFDSVLAYRISRDGEITSSTVEPRSAYRALISTMPNGGLLVVNSTGLELRASIVNANGTVQSLGTLAASAIPPSVVHLRRAGNAHLVTYLSLVEPDSGMATLILSDDGTVTPAPERAVELAPHVFTFTWAAESPLTTLVVYTPPGVYPAPLLQVATANDATATEPEVTTVAYSRQSQPILASAGGRVLAAWSDIQGTAAFIRTASLTPDATPLTDTIAAPAYLAARELAWNGAEFLAVGVRDHQVLATRLAFDGTPLDAEPLVLGQHQSGGANLNAAVTWAGDRWTVAWDTFDGISFSTIRNGTAQTKQLALGDLPVTNPALSFNGSTLLFVWNQSDSPPCYFPPCGLGDTYAFAAELTRDGELVDAKRVSLPFANHYSIATSGNEFLILGGTTATTIDAGVTRVLASRSIFNWGATSDVTWDGSSYAVALRYLGAVWHVSVTHLDRNLNVTGTPRGTPTLPPDDFVAPSIAGSLVGVQEGDVRNGTRAVVYREQDMPPLPPPPATPLNVRATPTGDGRFEITWDESPGAELYRVFIFGPSSGGLWSIFDIPATQPRSVIAQHPGARVIAFNAGGASDPLPRRRSTRR